MAHYFYGPDTYGARLALDELSVTTKARLHFLDKEHLEERSFDDLVAQSRGGLFGAELLVVRDPSMLPAFLQEILVNTYKKNPQALWVGWDRVNPDKKTSLWKSFKPIKKEFPHLSAGELSEWLVKVAAQEKSVIEKTAATELVKRVGEDRWQLLQEMRKLAIRHNPITVQHVQQEVASGQIEANVFHMLDALVRGNAAEAMNELEVCLAAGENEFRLLALLAYQIRVIFLITMARDGGSAKAIAQATGLHPFVVEKNMRLAMRISLARATDIYTRLLATDFSIKQGVVDARTGLTMLVLGLAQSLQQKTYTR